MPGLARRVPRSPGWTTGRKRLTLICGGVSFFLAVPFCFLIGRDFRSAINVQQTFGPLMVHQENPSVIINTGSKQGITNPPYVMSPVL